MNNFEKIKEFNINIVDFQERANKVLKYEDRLEYDTAIYSGPVDNIDILFLSINPGFNSEEWTARKADIDYSDLELGSIKYDKDGGNGELNKAINDVILNGKTELLANCAETYFKAIFASPNETILNQQLNKLPPELRAEHEKIMSDYREFVLNELHPKRIICLGIKVYDHVVSVLKIPTNKIESDRNRRFFCEAKFNDIPIFGVLHLSGARPSNKNKEFIRNYFMNLD